VINIFNDKIDNIKKKDLKDKVYINLKDIGSLKEKILLFIAENPRRNTQVIQRDLGYPENQYPNILRGVKALEKLELIKSTKSFSTKNVPMDLYSPADQGIIYIMTKKPNADLKKILDANKKSNDTARDLQRLYEVWGQESFTSFMRDMSQFLPMIAKNGVESSMPYIFMKGYAESRKLDIAKRKEFAANTMKEFPEIRQFIKEWKKTLDELV
jgi:hypothetical protein